MRAIAITATFAVIIAAVCAPAAAFDDQDGKAVESIVRRVADHVADTTDPADYDWNWGENTLMRGMIFASESTGEQRYFDFARKWLDVYCVGSGRYFVTEVDKMASGFSALLAYEKTKEKKYLNGTKTAERFIRQDTARLSGGEIVHNPGGKLWLDTLYMITPFMAHIGRIKKDSVMMDDAVNQILLNISHTESSETELSYHMWDPVEGHSPHFWARGNGWVVMATVEVLEVLPKDHPKRGDLIALLKRRCAAIAELQDASGLWHTVLDRPDSYLEVSASAMFSYAMQRGVARGWLPGYMSQNALRALHAIEPYIQPDGTVLGVSAGTGPGDFANYMKVPTGEYTWGTGATLLAFSERINFLKSYMRKN